MLSRFICLLSPWPEIRKRTTLRVEETVLRKVHTTWRFDRWRLNAVVTFRRVVSRLSPRHRALFLCLSTRSVEVRKMTGSNRDGAIGGRRRRRESERERERGTRPFRSTLMFCASWEQQRVPILVGYVLRIHPTTGSPSSTLPSLGLASSLRSVPPSNPSTTLPRPWKFARSPPSGTSVQTRDRNTARAWQATKIPSVSAAMWEKTRTTGW